jgi:hypothetical protein
MIITNLVGGLGNQMFQYAIGRALSLKYDRPLRLDISDFGNYQLHNGFELSRLFSAEMNLVSSKELKSVLGWRRVPFIKKQLLKNQFSMLRGEHLVIEPHFQFWEGIKNVPQDVYLYGYWQTEKYFGEYEHNIRNDFIFNKALEDKNKASATQILETNSVSLHVRRGDYVQNKKTLSTHGICSLDYYKSAIEHMHQSVVNPVFFIFSDDISWVKDNLKLESAHYYIENNKGLESYNDMHLMSICKHHILANSTFSWWGAWLNPSKDKVVVAPKNWFIGATNTRDLIPSNWFRL